MTLNKDSNHASFWLNFWLNNWYKKSLNLWTLLLVPFALIFRVVLFVRKYVFKSKYKSKSHIHTNINKPYIIVVGNITLGGTGKTPLIIALAKYLTKQGLKVGVISRGYGSEHARDNKNLAHEVLVTDPASFCADEPLLIKQALGNFNIPVVIAVKRLQALKKLMRSYPTCEVVLSDDGLQHYALPRDLEVVVVDAQRGFGNGWVLPAGPLREPLSRLKSVDYIVSNSNINNKFNLDLGLDLGLDLDKNKFSNMALVADKDIVLLDKNKNKNKKFSDFYNKNMKICAVCGIGNPQRFFYTLTSLGFKNFTKVKLADHKALSEQELLDLDADVILMTQKDAVKYQNMDLLLRSGKAWVVAVRAELDSDFLVQVVNKIKAK